MAEFILKDWYGKEKTFDKETIYAQDAEGNLIPFTQGDGKPTLAPLEVTENGTYEAPDGVDGYSPVTVNVPTPEIVLQDKTITENGTYEADEGYDGLGSVAVAVEGSGGGITFDEIALGQVSGEHYSENVTNLKAYILAGQSITGLTLPNLQTIGQYALYNCAELTHISVDKVTSVGTFAFANCKKLTKLDFGTSLKYQIGKSAFSTQGSELHVIIRNTTMIPDASSTSNYIMGNTAHYLYVPESLVTTWKNSNYMKSYHQDCVRAIEDYPDICG